MKRRLLNVVTTLSLRKALTPSDRDDGSDYFFRECDAQFGSFGVGRWVVP